MSHLDQIDLPGIPVTRPHDPVVYARIARPVGIKGDIKVILESAVADRLYQSDNIIVSIGGSFRSFQIESCLPSGKWFRIHLKDIDSPESAGLLAGCEIVGDAGKKPKLDDGEYYVDEIIGCFAFSDDDTDLGIVREVMHQGWHDIWVIDGQFGEILIPAVEQFILSVDLNHKRIIIKRIEGLWDER